MINSDKLVFPIFDGKETLTQFMKRAKEFELQVKINKYDTILKFVNALINPKTKYTSLTEFINVSRTKLISDVRHNKTIIDKFGRILSEELNINILELTRITAEEEGEDDDYETSDIIMFLKRILNAIEYSIISKTVDGEIYYTIKSRPMTKSRMNHNQKTNIHINNSL